MGVVMTREQKYLAFKALHERPGAFVIPNPWNAGTARILTSLGYDALATTSAGYAFAVGRRDSSAGLSRDEILQNAREIVDATDLPVSADLEDGFGRTPEICAATVMLAAEAGLVGGSIEDATGHAKDPIYEFNLSVERVEAAVQAARKYKIVLTARAENFLHGRPDLDDTIRRLKAFAQVGADVVYAPGLPSLEAIRGGWPSVPKPVKVGMGLRGPAWSGAELASVGVKRISVGGSFARAALGAFVRAAREVKEHGTFTYATDAISHADVSRYMASGNREQP